MSVANIRVQLDDLEKWIERLQDFGVVEVGPHVDDHIYMVSNSIGDLVEHYRGLVEKAEKEMVG